MKNLSNIAFEEAINQWANQEIAHNPYNQASIMVAVNIMKKVKEENITTLTLEKLNLTSIPPAIGQLTQLEYLFLSDNQIRDIPCEIWQLTQLKQLCFANNNISVISSEIEQLTQLEYLFLSKNAINNLPDNITKLYNIIVIDLIDNPLTIEAINLIMPLSDFVRINYNQPSNNPDYEDSLQIKIEQFIKNLLVKLGYDDVKIHDIMQLVKDHKLEDFFTKIAFAPICQNYPDILKKGLDLIVSKLLNPEFQENIIRKISNNCAIFIVNFLISQYLESQDQNKIDEEILRNIALRQYIIEKHQESFFKKNTQIELIYDLLSPLFSKDLFKPEFTTIADPKNAQFIDFTFKHIEYFQTEDKIEYFAKKICQTNAEGKLITNSNGLYLPDNCKIRKIIAPRMLNCNSDENNIYNASLKIYNKILDSNQAITENPNHYLLDIKKVTDTLMDEIMLRQSENITKNIKEIRDDMIENIIDLTLKLEKQLKPLDTMPDTKVESGCLDGLIKIFDNARRSF